MTVEELKKHAVLEEPPYRRKSSSAISSFYQQLSIRIDAPVRNMSISPSGRDIVLASRVGLYILDLETPYKPPRVIHHYSRWDVADVMWNPHNSRDTWIVSTANQKTLVWNVALSAPRSIEYVLHGHSRAITDVSWSPIDPQLLGTSSIDTFVHIWDLRTPSRPSQSFCAWTAGATQIDFNPNNEYLVASSHETELNIWDCRKGTEPVIKFSPQNNRVYGISWNTHNPKEILTCGLDKTVKIWNIDDASKCHGTITTNSPIRRARFTPFGDGIVTMPQRGDANMYMWSRSDLTKPVCTFEGHTDTIREFVWRIRGEKMGTKDFREFQLVSWSNDQHLRLWPIDDSNFVALGHKSAVTQPASPITLNAQTVSYRQGNGRTSSGHVVSPPLTSYFSGHSHERNIGPTFSVVRPSTLAALTRGTAGFSPGNTSTILHRERRSMSPLGWMQGVRMLKSGGEDSEVFSGNPHNLAEEFAWISKKYQDIVKFEKINLSNRTCTLTLYGPWSDNGSAFLRVNIAFPTDYPDDTPPIFDIQKTGVLQDSSLAHLLEQLQQISAAHVPNKVPCLDECINFLLGESFPDDSMDKLNIDDSDDESIQHREGRRLASVIADKDDQNVPFPRMCGAIFTGNDKLVYFFSSLRLPNLGTMGSKPGKSKSSMKSSYTYVHPRSYDSLEQFKAVSRLPKRITTRRLEEGNSFEDQDQDEDELLTIPSLFFKPKNLQPTRGISAADTPGDVTLYPGAKQQSSGNFIGIMDVSGLLPINRELAPHYTLLGDDPVQVCRHNANAALGHNRDDLFKVWSLAALILTECVGSVENLVNVKDLVHPGIVHESINSLIDNKRVLETAGWGGHPFGRVMVQSLMQHFEKLGDVQTLALLACVFSQPFPPRDNMIIDNIQPDQLGPTDYFNVRSYRSNFNNPSWGDNNGNSTIDQILRTPFTVPAKLPRSSSLSSQFSSRPGYPTLDDSPRGIQQYEGFQSNMSRKDSYIQNFNTPRGAFSSQSHVPPGIGSGGGSSSASYAPPQRKDSSASAYNQSMYTPYLGNRSRRGSLTYDYTAPSFTAFKRRVTPSIVPIDTVKITMMNEDEFDDEKRPAKVALLDPALGARYDYYRLAYAETLYRWGLLDGRAEVLKFIAIHKPWNSLIRSESRQIGLEFATYCSECNKELPPGGKCFICDRKRAGLKCVICRVTVKGLTNFCLLCLHGGHSNHIRDWFMDNQMCPTGCGCLCILNSGGFGAS